MAKNYPSSSAIQQKRMTRRSFVKGAALGGAGIWAASALPRRVFTNDPHRPPKLYEYFLDNFWFEEINLYEESINPPLKGRQLADIAIVGGGFAGMSAAYNLRRRFPDKRIVLLEGACCGYGASGATTTWGSRSHCSTGRRCGRRFTRSDSSEACGIRTTPS